MKKCLAEIKGYLIFFSHPYVKNNLPISNHVYLFSWELVTLSHCNLVNEDY